MLELFIPLLSTVFGSVGALMKGKQERKTEELRLQYQLKNRDKDLEELKIENEHRLRVTETEGEIARDLSADQTLQASYTALKPAFLGTKNKWLMFVDGCTQMMRPVITLYLLAVTSYMAYCVDDVVNGFQSLDSIELVALYKNIIMSLISLTMTTVGWWFGSRPTTKWSK